MTGAECSDSNSVDKVMSCQTRKVLHTERNIKEVSDVSGIIFHEQPKPNCVLCYSGTE